MRIEELSSSGVPVFHQVAAGVNGHPDGALFAPYGRLLLRSLNVATAELILSGPDPLEASTSRVEATGTDSPRPLAAEVHRAHELLAGDDQLRWIGDVIDPEWSQAIHAEGLVTIRFVAMVPVFSADGTKLGTLCVADPKPRALCRADVDTLETIAQAISTEVELRRISRIGEFRERMLATVAHDLRSPLLAIKGAVALGMRKQGATERYLSQISVSAERMTRMIRDLLDYTVCRTSGGLAITRGVVDVAAVIDDVLTEFRFAYPGRTLRLVACDANVAEWDADRVRQILCNLVANALRHGDADGAVDVSAHRDGTDIVLNVHNEGQPISPAVLPRLFSPLARSGNMGVAGSYGLGLVIVREIARAHGGTVSVSSTAEEGTTFSVRMPRTPSAVTH